MEPGDAELTEGQIDRLHAQLVSLANRFGMLEGSVARLRQRLDAVLAALDDAPTPVATAGDESPTTATPRDLDGLRAAIDALGARLETFATSPERSAQDPLAQRAAVAAAHASSTAESTAAAVASLEARLDRNFETMGHRLDALAALLNQTVTSIEHLEEHTGDVQPVGERMRQAGTSIVTALKTRSTRGKTDAPDDRR